MSATMRAAVAHHFGRPLSIEELPVPVPGAGQVLIRLMASGVCHTDLHAVNGDWPVRPQLPFIPGHEGAGIVAALGAGVKDLKEGDRVGVPWVHDACGVCEFCVSGWETLCESQHNTGYSVNGTFADYVLGDAKYVARLPGTRSFSELAPILCAGVTTYKGIKETEVVAGEWIAISGVGGLGHLAVQYAKAMGLHVVALDVAPSKLRLAEAAGADLAVDATSPDSVERVIKATSGGAHGVLVTAVSLPAFNQALHMVRRRGTVSLVGLPPGEFPTPVFDVVLKRITIRGSIVGTREDLTEALAFADSGQVKAHFTTAQLDNVNEVLNALSAGKVDGRIVLEVGLPTSSQRIAESAANA